MTSPADKRTLSNGTEMPCCGLGTAKSYGDEAIAAIKTAVRAGCRLIDTASRYRNEEAVGIAIKELIEEGVVKREDLFISTKAWTDEMAPKRLKKALRRSLHRLQLDYVDLYIAHMPIATKVDVRVRLNVTVEDIWRQFDEVYKAGLTKAVGVSNWSIDQIDRVNALGLTRVHNCQMEFHAHFPHRSHLSACVDRNIVVTAYATLGSLGRLEHTVEGGSGKRVSAGPDSTLLIDPHVLEVAEKYNKTAAQVLLGHALYHSVIVIPKSINPKHIKENLDIFDFSLTIEDVVKCETNWVAQRLFPQHYMAGHREDAFAEERKFYK
uniref:Aldo_ket_red domain-containing protein n=1 Tax=Caenorhabditis tropicalis TaxID=1561998 RepID=A0A1I7TWI0_9PELO